MTEQGPSPHLTWGELACKDEARTPYPEYYRAIRAVPLAETFERIRAAIGHRPLRIGSAYRTRAHNSRIGGAADSMHLYGLALDLYPPTGIQPATLYDASAEVLAGVGGLFLYGWGVHVDRRDLITRVPARGNYRFSPPLRLPLGHRMTTP